jgi:outer membrane murein-binding lipoprotein Lpp
MSHSPRFPAAASVAVLLSLILCASVPAATKPDPAVPPPADAITAADVKSLQEAIKSLHARFEAQGKILEKNSDDLGTLTKRVDDYLKPSLLKPLEDGLGTVVKKLSDLNEAQGNLAAAQAKAATDAAAQYREVTAALTRLQEALAKSDQAGDASIADLRKTIAATHATGLGAAVPAAEPTPLAPLLGAIAAATLLLIVVIFLSGRAHRAAHAQLAAALAETREALRAELQARTPAAPAVAAGGAGTGGADILAENVAKLQSVIAQLNPDVPAVPSDDHTTKNFTASPADERTTVHQAPAVGPGIASAACWPAAFFDADSPLTPWRVRIESHLGSKEHPALPVFSAFLALRTLCARTPAPVLAEVGAAVVALSQALYAYWESLPELGEDERARASSDWIQAVKALTADAAPKLEIREIIVGTRFDSDSMQTVQEGSGNHLTVVAVHSWATLDRSGERVKILQRARIATN